MFHGRSRGIVCVAESGLAGGCVLDEEANGRPIQADKAGATRALSHLQLPELNFDHDRNDSPRMSRSQHAATRASAVA